jgi:hypothetical protein
MLAFLRGKASERKLRLFACACCRQLIWHRLTDDRSRQAVAVAERFADGRAFTEELEAARVSAGEAVAGVPLGTRARHSISAAQAVTRTDWPPDVMAVHTAFTASASGVPWLVGRQRMSRVARERQRAAREEERADRARQADLLRDLVGSPPLLRPAVGGPAVLGWNGGIVGRLAQAAYEDRLPSGHLEPGRLAVLADALEDACGDPEMLGHLRGPGQHVRGCWVIDLLLGKE